MAGDWMKVEKVTPDKPEVYAIAAELGIDPEAVFCKLFRIWTWFDDHTESGNARGVTSALLDSRAGVTGFAQAMENVGWLRSRNGGLTLPNFDYHNGKTAKNRAQTRKRVGKHRNARSVTDALPEKRREEKSIESPTDSLVSEPQRKPDLIWDATIEHLFPSLNGSNLNGRDRKRVGAIVSDLKARKATPDEIAKRWAECQRRYDRPGVDALVKHWDELGQSQSRGGSDLVRRALDGEFD